MILFISAQAVALIDAEKMVQLWRVDTAHSLAVREKRPLIQAIYLIKRSFCLDMLGSRYAPSGTRGKKRVFFTHFHTQVRSVSFSPDGKYIASASTVR